MWFVSELDLLGFFYAKVDDFMDRIGVPASRDIAGAFGNAMTIAQAQTDDKIVEEWMKFINYLPLHNQTLVEGANVALGKWRYLLMVTGLQFQLNGYIHERVANILNVLCEIASDHFMYASGRVRGIFTDDEHSMSFDEFVAHRRGATNGVGRLA